MLTETEINEYKKTLEKGQKAQQELNAIEAEINVHKKQCIEKLKSYNCSSFKDIDTKLLPKLEELETQIREHSKEVEDYIKYVNEKKEEKESIIMEG